jgi:cytoskeletal protein RodZ
MLLLIGGLTNAQTIKRSKQKTEQTTKNNDSKNTNKIPSKPSNADSSKSKSPSSSKKSKSRKADTSPSDRESKPSRSNSGSLSSQSSIPTNSSTEPNTYKVTISCNVPDADLYIDDKDYGHPKGTHSLNAGSHQVKLVSEGYDDYTTNIQVNAGSTSFDFRMTRIRYENVAFTCNVQNAQLFVDGHNLGNANGIYQITASNHLIRVKSDGYQERIIYFDASSNSTLNIELSPE